jgi:hypothetical protein
VAQGLGWVRRLFGLLGESLRGDQQLIRSCTCLDGCRVCVGPIELGGYGIDAMSLRLVEFLTM